MKDLVLKDFWGEVGDLERRMDEVARDLIGRRAIEPLLRRPVLPVMDVYVKGPDLVARVELPGIDPKTDVHVEIEDGDLVVRGERTKKEEVKEDEYYRMETVYGAFERAIPLPEGIDEDSIKAEYGDGVLTITVPKGAEPIEAPKPKEIAVTMATPVKAA